MLSYSSRGAFVLDNAYRITADFQDAGPHRKFDEAVEKRTNVSFGLRRKRKGAEPQLYRTRLYILDERVSPCRKDVILEK